MRLLGEGVLVLWFDVDVDQTAEFEDWHSHEHMPERLRVPGFLRGVRWVLPSGAPTYFVMYEVVNFDTLTSVPYLERLNNPTPWTAKVMPHVRNTTRSLCRIRGSFGLGIGQTMLTIRFSPAVGQEDALRSWLTQAMLPELARRPGMINAHVIEAEPPAKVPKMKEQELRGGDASADWVLLASGYDPHAVVSVSEKELHEQVLAAHGASRGQIRATYQLGFALSDRDLGALDRGPHEHHGAIRSSEGPPVPGREHGRPST